MNRRPSLATTALVCGAAAAAIVTTVTAGGGAGVASADPSQAYGYSWCPGQALPFPGVRWDESVCHTYYIAPTEQANVTMVDLHGNPLKSWLRADSPPVLVAPPPPPPPPPGTPFCSPRGALFIIGPICDEIGVDNPPGSVRR